MKPVKGGLAGSPFSYKKTVAKCRTGTYTAASVGHCVRLTRSPPDPAPVAPKGLDQSKM